MCSYNKVNGTYACENYDLLNTDLRERLGFKGFVMSDWSATKNMTKGTVVNNGMD
jgi:beta-glucosidase